MEKLKKYRRKNKIISFCLICILSITMLNGCGEETALNINNSETVTETSLNTASSIDYNMELTESTVNKEFTDREQDASYDTEEAFLITLKDNKTKVSNNSVTVKDNTVKITKAGTYIISGTLENGQIIIDASKSDKIQLVLKNAEINCDTSAAIYVKQADKVFLTLDKNSKNILSGGTNYVDIDDNTIDGVIYSKDDLCINGSGELTVEANYKHGIVSKDDLVIISGIIHVTAVKQCLSGKACIRIKDGTFELETKGKGLKSDNTDDTKQGNIYIANGTFQINSEDDALHASGSMVIDDGNFTINAGDDAFHADVDTVVNNGTIKIISCYEGLEGHRVVVNGGEITLTASDDGINAADPNASSEATDIPHKKTDSTDENTDSSTPNEDNQKPTETENKPPNDILDENTKIQPPSGDTPSIDDSEGRKMLRGGKGGGSKENDMKTYIKITGGTIKVSADGDGIDSNGGLMVTGGTIYVNGSVGKGDGALDYDGEGIITGGIVAAVGSSGMAQSFGETSTQYSFMQVLTESQKAGAKISVKDSTGKELLNYTPEKDYDCVVISSPDLKKGAIYTLTAGTETADITLESIAVSNKTEGMKERGRTNSSSSL